MAGYNVGFDKGKHDGIEEGEEIGYERGKFDTKAKGTLPEEFDEDAEERKIARKSTVDTVDIRRFTRKSTQVKEFNLNRRAKRPVKKLDLAEKLI